MSLLASMAMRATPVWAQEEPTATGAEVSDPAEAGPEPTTDPAPEPTTEPTEDPAPAEDSTEGPSPDQDDPSDFSGPADPLIVKLQPGLSAQEQQDAIERNGGRETSSVPALRLHMIEVPRATSDEALSALRSDPAVDSAERDLTREAEGTPSDPAYADQWNLPQVSWDQVYGSVEPAGVATIAVLDTGVDHSQPDLEGRMGTGHSVLEGPATSDPNGHGTALATIAAAAADNSTGIAGVAYSGAQVMSVRVLGADGTGQDSDIIAGLVWAADHGADVILMGFSNPGMSSALQDAVDYAWAQGAVLVASAGNGGSSDTAYPAGYAHVVGVAATDPADELWSGSNTGGVFMAAPGTDVPAGTPGGGTTSITGTSASAAMVAGAAGLMMAADGSSNGVVVNRLGDSADPAGGGTGAGRLNVAGALGATGDDDTPPPGDTGEGETDEPYVADAATVNSATLNGGSTVTVATGASITAVVNISGSSGAGGANRADSIGWRIDTTTSTPMTCVPITRVDGTNQNRTITITAPSTVGTYNAYFRAFSDSSCSQNASNLLTMSSAVTTQNPAPTTSSISPTTKNVGDGEFALTVNGTGFVSSSVVRLDGSDRTTTFVSSTQLTATIPAGDLSSPTDLSITVFNPTPGGGTSGAQTLTVRRATSTSVTCSPATLTSGSSTNCTATVTDTNSGTTSAPSGTATFSGAGVSGTPSCTLGSPSEASASCAASLTPTSSGTLTATYTGSGTHGASSGTAHLDLLSSCGSFSATLEGQSKNSAVWQGTNLQNWAELDHIPVRVRMCGAVTSQAVTVTFDHTKTSGSTRLNGIDNFFGVNGDPLHTTGTLATSPNVTITNKTFSFPANSDTWSYTFTVNKTGNEGGFLEFRAALSADAHNFTGSSLQMGGSPSLGQLQIAKPSVAPGSPDLQVTKSGPATAAPGSTITYTLNFSNKSGAANTATGVQLKDLLPSTLTYVPDSCTGCTLAGQEVTWNLGSLAPGDSGSRTFQATVSPSATNGSTFTNRAQIRSAENDASPADNDAELTTTVSVANGAPVANNDAYQTNEDTPLTVNAPGVLTNDTDPNGDSLTVASPRPASETSNGSLTLNADGSFTYTPDANFHGADSFTYKATDGSLDSNVATVTITITPVNDAPTAADDEYQTDEDTELQEIAPGVLGNDADIDGDTLTAVLVDDASDGTLALDADGSFTYDPDPDFNGTDTFTYKADDGDLLSNLATVTITVGGENDAPVADPKSVTTDEDTPKTITLSGSDVDGDSLTFEILGGPSDGSLGSIDTPSCSAGSCTADVLYSPDPDFNGGDSFTYRVDDGIVSSTAATVTITVDPVNDAPQATDDDYQTDEDTQLVEIAPGVLGNDSDADGDGLTAALVDDVADGTLSLEDDGSFTYDPDPDFNGTDSFTYRADDGNLQSNLATVTITVGGENDAPVLDAIADREIDEETELTFTASAIDVDGDALTFSLIGAPAGASIDADTGQFTWTPSESQGPATYTFTVKVTDDGDPSLSDEVQVTVKVLEVNRAPELDLLSDETIPEAQLFTFTATASDPDIPANTLTFSLIDAPAGASIDPDTGAFTWTPSESQGPATYTFTVKVTDDGDPSLSDEQEITLTVTEANVPPTLAAIDDDTIPEMVLHEIQASGSDADDPPNTLTYSIQGADHGASIDPDTGLFSWTPTEAQGPGSYGFTIRVSDPDTEFDERSFTLTVTEVNRAPSIGPIGNKQVGEMSQLSFTAPASDPDLPANGLTFSMVGTPAGASIDAATGAFSWTPTEAQGPGSYPITIRVSDDGSPNLSAEEQITITVLEVNRPPVLAPIGNKALIWGEQLAFTATATDPDIPANSLTYSMVGAPAGATINSATGAFSWKPQGNQVGTFNVKIRVTDNGAPKLTAEELITITVNKRPTALVYSGDATGQYSDVVTVRATLTDNGGGALQGKLLASKTVLFTIGTQSAPMTTSAAGVAQRTMVLAQGAGSPGVGSSFAGDAQYLPSSDSDPFSITREQATLEYAGDTLRSTGSTSATSKASVKLKAIVHEDPDGSLGSKLSSTAVKFTVYRYTDIAMTNPVGTCTSAVTGLGTGLGSAACTLLLGPDTYTVKFELVANDWYTAPLETHVVTVHHESGAFSVGGGIVPESGGANTSFGFAARAGSRGAIVGNSEHISRVTTDIGYGVRKYNWIIRSTSLTSHLQQCDAETGVCHSRITGKASIWALDRITGVVHSIPGTYDFQIDSTDAAVQGNLTANGPDRYTLRVWDGTGTYYEIGSADTGPDLTGGDVPLVEGDIRIQVL
jgi:uncharacterized repeat protein (TIGR01451 family)